MPELPEVQTTVDGLNKTVKGRIILDVWTDYKSAHKMHKESIKDPLFFKQFKKKVTDAKILRAERRAKNVLIHLDNGETILIHMKMTGHLMYGAYIFNKKENKWLSKNEGPLRDPFNQFLHLVFTLDNRKHLAFSDVRKFAKVTIVERNKLNESLHVMHLGPEPLDQNFTFLLFRNRLMKRPKSKIKQALMDQTLLVGIGNIYSDEILWRSSVHPESIVKSIPDKELKNMYTATLETLLKGIDLGGDSTSDYRNIYGERGQFQANHNAYQMHKKECKKKGCTGILERIVVGGRGTHFCPAHQQLFK